MKMRLRLGAKRRASAMKLPRRTAIPPAARERSPVLAMLGPNTIRVSFASRAGTLPHAGSGELVISSGGAAPGRVHLGLPCSDLEAALEGLDLRIRSVHGDVECGEALGQVIG